MSMDTSTVDQPDSFAFSADNRKMVKTHLAKYPKGKQASAVMPLLDLAQRQHDGWLPRAAMDHIAELLGMPNIRVYEVATFYTMYNLSPIGKNHVQVCTSVPCWLRGSDAVVDACKKKLGIDFGETSDDGQFTLTEVECQGACVNAPMVLIGDDFYEDLDEGSMSAILDQLQNGDTPKPGPQNDRKGCEPQGGVTTLKGNGGGG